MFLSGKGCFDPNDQEKITEIRTKYRLRRADRYTALVLGACMKAVRDAYGDTAHLPDSTGMICAGSFGPHVTVFNFLNELQDFSEDEVTPTKFAHSVFNGAASYAAQIFNANGPAYTLTGFRDLFYEALCNASMLLDAGICKNIVLTVVEESGFETDYISRHLLPLPQESAYAFVFGVVRGKYSPLSSLSDYRGDVSVCKAADFFNATE